MTAELGLRERKKRRTRRALIEAAIRLFDAKGYEHTTVAEIAAAADVSVRTFFTYFVSKEDVLFLQREGREEELIEAVAARRPGEPVSAALLRLHDALIASVADDDEVDIALSPVRGRLVLSEPALRARGMAIMFDLQPKLAKALHRAYPDQLDLVAAAAAVGSVLGAMAAAGIVAQERGDPPEQVLAAGRRAVELAIRGLATIGEPDQATRSPAGQTT